jgi:hypothetical protein
MDVEVPMIDAQTTLDAYFRDLLAEALEAERCAVAPEVRQYLTQLCVDFAQAHGVGDAGATATLAWLYRAAREAPPAQRFEAYRRLGDVALVAPSFFAPYVERRRSLVGRGYYVEMGAAAYDAAADLARSGFRHLLRELSDQFRSLVDVLTRMAEATTLPMQQDLERLVERLREAPADGNALRQLRGQGLVPVWTGDAKA